MTQAEKYYLRTKFKKVRDTLLAERKRAAGAALLDMAYPYFSKGNPVLSYSHIGSEVPTWSVNRKLLDENKLALPKVTKKGLKIYRILKLSDLEIGAFNILEPKSSCEELPLIKISVALIPGLAFDNDGGRLGHGQGYYDQLLSTFVGLKLGVAYVEQRSSKSLPKEGWDIAMDEVLWV